MIASNVYASTHFTFTAINSILDDFISDFSETRDNYIFVFENNWISLEEFTLLNSRVNKNTIIICSSHVKIFIKAWFPSDCFIFLPLKCLLRDMTRVIRAYISNDIFIDRFRKKQSCSALKTSKIEIEVLNLFLSGKSIYYISRSLRLSEKRIYGIRNKALKNLGVINLQLLVRYREIVNVSSFLIDVKKQIDNC